MQKFVLLGDEAIAQGAIDAGITAIYAYPGTPSTEITEYVIQSDQAHAGQVHASWCANEKTAMEAALGVSYAGKRAMVSMKHVGLNVAADPFINSAITGANGGLIVVAADDPSMHSSQNEQDSRFYGKFAMIPMLEPGNQQEAYDMVFHGFELSEKFGTPVLMRITTRLAHSRAGVIRKEKLNQNDLRLPDDLKQFILLPANARRRFTRLLQNQQHFLAATESSPYNVYLDGADKSLGIITAGIAFNYLLENYPDRVIPYPVVKIGQYPLPGKLIERLYDDCEQILVLEDGYPFIEEMLPAYFRHQKTIRGRLDGSLSREGELNPCKVASALGIRICEGAPVPGIVSARPPSLCKGCPHISSYQALNEALDGHSRGRVFSDIGCYTLGALEPYHAINTCVDMGASITMAKGAADAGLSPVVAVIGDSTFTHSGITGLLDAVNGKAPITVLILDNETTAMTGGQPSAGENKLEAICEAVGVERDHIFILNPIPKEHGKNLEIIKKELAYQGVSVIIPRRECIQTAIKRLKADKQEKMQKQEA
jgi:indolepyruvate ferredoxin oxidoreductase alpha subunit